jgi:hypothetical protein
MTLSVGSIQSRRIRQSGVCKRRPVSFTGSMTSVLGCPIIKSVNDCGTKSIRGDVTAWTYRQPLRCEQSVTRRESVCSPEVSQRDVCGLWNDRIRQLKPAKQASGLLLQDVVVGGT